jgi:uncharacterized protein (DUF58 family)
MPAAMIPTVPPDRPSLELEPLPRSTRILLLILGSVLVFLGILGLALPFLQGILFLIAGAALLSLGSERIFLRLKQTLERWPGAHHRLVGMHGRLHRRLQRPLPSWRAGVARAAGALGRLRPGGKSRP